MAKTHYILMVQSYLILWGMILKMDLITQNLKIYSSIPLKKPAFCLKTSHFINKYDSPRSQLCQWPRLVHNCNQSFNPWPIVARFDSHLNIPASHLGIPGGVVNLEFRDVIDHLAFCL